MNTDEFKQFGYSAINYVANYVDTLRDRPVIPDVKPGFLYDKIPNQIPEKGESWELLLEDFDKIIMPGMVHWQSPKFHSFFPSGSSYPSIIGEIFSAALGVIGLHWAASPACTELEVMMMDWMGKLINLPPQFLNSSSGPGGGVLQGSASETTLLCLLAAKMKSIRRIKKLYPELSEDEISNRLIAYTSDQANSSVEKSGILGSMKMRILKTDKNGVLRKEMLERAMKKDYNEGFFPCYMIGTIGSTGICISDKLDVIGPICKKYNVWLHIDAAYAGSALILPEYQYLLNGIEHVDSFNFNPHKWLLVNFDCSALWVQDARTITDGFVVNRIYLQEYNKDLNTQVPEYRHWQIPLGRRFRALKLWFTLRSYGKEGLQAHIRNHINLAKYFNSLVEQDARFEIIIPARFGLVCFRLKGENKLTETLHTKLLSRRNVYMLVATIGVKFVLRFVVCSRLSTKEDINYSWNEIKSQANEVLSAEHSANGHSMDLQLNTLDEIDH